MVEIRGLVDVKPNDVDLRERIYGCLLGVAIGDALGMPSSFLPKQEIERIYGRIQDFEDPLPDHIYHSGYEAGQVTDDTEQTILIAETLLEAEKADPRQVADALLGWFERVGGSGSDAVGPSSMRALKAISAGGDLKEAGKRGDTNGAAMRISSVGILHGRNRSLINEIVADVYQVCLPTHGSNLAVSGASAVACAVSSALRGRGLKKVVVDAIDGAREGAQQGFPVIGPSMPRRIEFAMSLVEEAQDIDAAADDIYQLIGAGVAIEQSVPASLGLYLASKGDPQRGILKAVNMGGDADTVASMVGALCGAFSGPGAFQEDWVKTVEEVNQLNLRGLADRLYQASTWWGSYS